jgi:transposase
MTRYIGLDAHSESCTLAVVGPSGRQLRHERLETRADVLKDAVRKVPRPRELCIEEGNLSAWLYEELEPIVDNLIVVIPDKPKGNKSDLRDAFKLADGLRQGAFKRQVFKEPSRYRGLREAVRAHYVTKRDKVRCNTRIHALCRGCGLPELAKLLYEPESRPEALLALPEHLRRRAALYGQQLDAQTDVMKQAEHWLKKEAKQVPILERISTAPAIGVIRSSYIVAIVVTPHRFRTSRQFWAYCGLGIVTHSSSDWSLRRGSFQRRDPQPRGLNRNRNALLKNVFKAAAKNIAQMPDHPLGLAYQQLTARTKPNLALLTIARRLSAAVLAMWKKNEDYDAMKHLARNSS